MVDPALDPIVDPAGDDADGRPSAVLRLEGDVDLASESLWRERGEQLLADDPEVSELIVDMSGVGFLDSRGLALLVHLYRLALRRDGRLVLVAVPRRVEKAVRLAGLSQLFEVHGS